MAYAQFQCSPSPPLSGHYAETVSAIHPDRPIRPLPKRRLEKLSNARSTSAASPHKSSRPERVFQVPYYAAPNPSQRHLTRKPSMEAEKGESLNSNSPENRKVRMTLPVRSKVSNRGPENSAAGASSFSAPAATNSVPAVDGREKTWNGSPNETQPLSSSADSVDGYDSFENTNNKKKRKIPMNGGHHTTLSTEMGLPSTRDTGSPSAEHEGGVGQYYGSGSSAVPAKAGAGISGAGRGRISRVSARRRSNRSPLGVSTNSGNLNLPNYASSVELATKENVAPFERERDALTVSDVAHGPMSQSPLSKRYEDLTPQSIPRENPGGKTQFTFTCESDTAKSISWPEYGYPSLPGAYPDPMINGIDGAFENVSDEVMQDMKGYGPTGAPAENQRAGTGHKINQPRRTKRSIVKQYSSAAKERKVRQAYSNFHHPPRLEDVWICEYCEYEAIFGRPPEALIRQYEIKDRRERRRLAEKQRLLEKAKMRNKRGKKGNKNLKNANVATQAQPAQQQAQKPRQDHLPGEYPQEQADVSTGDYLLDDYDEDPAVTPTLPLKASVGLPPHQHLDSKQKSYGHPHASGQGFPN